MNSGRLPSFHALTTGYTGLVPFITTDVEISEAFDINKPPQPLPQMLKIKALWDTGATGSQITEEVAKSLNLICTGTTYVQHARGVDLANTYLVNLVLPFKVIIAGVPVCECKNVVGHFGAIIGMDIILRGDFAITNVRGQTCMSFRMPSCETIDYVSEARKHQFNGILRNEPCPCGSGKKFKKCHGKNV